jgi:hypothetical protein
MGSQALLLAAGIGLALMGLFAAFAVIRARGVRRWLSALDAYAEREIARGLTRPYNGARTRRIEP